MHNLFNLFKIVQITRDQPQYGYNLAGLHKYELSDLAQHHYLVTFIGWQLCQTITQAGGKIDTLRVMEICMIHDIGELFGGDISFFYATANPKAREFAKNFEQENNNFLSKLFPDSDKFQKLIDEMNTKETDEAIVAKVADYTEVVLYKTKIGKLSSDDISSNGEVLKRIAEKAEDENVRQTLLDFLNNWSKELPGKTPLEIIKGQDL